MQTRRCVAVGVAVALLACGSAFGAAPSSGVQKRLDKAAKLFKEARYEAALVELKAIDKTGHLPAVRFNIARCYEELGRSEEAVAAFERYLSSNDTAAGGADRVRRAREALDRYEKKTFGSLEVLCEPADTRLEVEGISDLASCPFKSDRVKPGSYKIAATAPGHEPFQERTVIRPGQLVTMHVKLIKSRPAAKPREVSATDVDYPLAPGKPAGGVAARSEEKSSLGVIGTGLLITGGVALAGGGVFLYLGNDINKRIEAGEYSTAKDIEDAERKGSLYNTLALGTAAVGVAAAGAGVVMMILAPGDRPAGPELSVGPIPGGGALISLGGSL